MKRTAPPCPLLFRTPRAAGAWMALVVADVDAQPAAVRAVIEKHAGAARTALLRALIRWNEDPREMVRVDAAAAAAAFGWAVYGDGPNPYERSRLERKTHAAHVRREEKARAFLRNQESYRRAIGLEEEEKSA